MIYEDNLQYISILFFGFKIFWRNTISSAILFLYIMPNLGNVIWAKICFTIKLCKCLFSYSVIVTQERQKALEEMGISIQSSGIAVEKNKFYLVNLNADPSLNELLVYYLKVGGICFLLI